MSRKTYATGTPVTEIQEFDRSQHVEFRCKKHENAVYFSKDPRISTWFVRNDGVECRCKDLSGFETVSPYTPGVPAQALFRAPNVWPQELMNP